MSSFDSQLSARPDSHESRQTGIDDRTPALKRTAQGMIDYDFYLRRGRRIRGQATNSFLRSVGKALRSAIRGTGRGAARGRRHGRPSPIKAGRAARQAHSGASFARPAQSHL